jgi:hypothetical protein
MKRPGNLQRLPAASSIWRMTSRSIDINIGVTIRVTGFWASQALSDAGNPRSRLAEMQDKETQMKRILRLTVALLLGAAVISPILGASQANACHYTSQDRAKGYKC